MITTSELRWNEDGLIPAVVQNAENKEILDLAYVDQNCLESMEKTGIPCYRGVSADEILSRENETVEAILTTGDLDTLIIVVSGKELDGGNFDYPLYTRE